MEPIVGAGRVQQWLYPIFDGTDRACFGRDGTCRARFTDYRRAATSGQIGRGEGPLDSGFLSIRVGDVLWLYAGNEIGVVGRAIVRELTGRPEPWVTFTLDRAVSRVLALDPVPASLARRHLTGPTDRPLDLAAHPELPEGFHWWIDHLDERDQQRLAPLGVRSIRQALVRQPTLLDDRTTGALVRTLRTRDLALGVPAASTGASVVACDDRVVVVARVVPGSKAIVPRQVLASTGILAWYARSLALHDHGLRLEPSVWFAFKSPPPADLLHFLEERHDSVSWTDGERMEFGPRTKQWWPLTAVRLGGDRDGWAPASRTEGSDTTRGHAEVEPPAVKPLPRGSWATSGEAMETVGVATEDAGNGESAAADGKLRAIGP